MRFPIVILLILLYFPAAFSQTKPIVEDKGNFGLHVVNDRIRSHKYLERDNQLLLVGWKHLQLLDLTNFKVIYTRPIDLPYSVGCVFDDDVTQFGRAQPLYVFSANHTSVSLWRLVE